MKNVTHHKRLGENPCIQFHAPDLSTLLGRKQWHPVLTSAAAILMPSFNENETKDQFHYLVRHAPQTLAIVRCYPQGYDKPRANDTFRPLPDGFDVPDHIVEYGSEILLQHLHRRSRILESRYDYLKWALSLCVMSLLVGAGVIGRMNVENADFIRKVIQPADAQQAWSDLFALSRTTVQQSIGRAIDRGEVHPILQKWAAVTVQELNRVSADTTTKVLAVFFRGPDAGSIQPLVSFGEDTPNLSLAGSIAGCALTHKVTVYWKGQQEMTDRIEAWDANSESVGQYDAKAKVLILPDGATCKYQTGRSEPKRQLLCVPIAGGASQASAPVVACMTVDTDKSFVREPWFRQALATMSGPLALVEFNPQGATLPKVLTTPNTRR